MLLALAAGLLLALAAGLLLALAAGLFCALAAGLFCALAAGLCRYSDHCEVRGICCGEEGLALQEQGTPRLEREYRDARSGADGNGVRADRGHVEAQVLSGLAHLHGHGAAAA